MSAFSSLLRELDIWHLRWALRDLPSTHPDVPRIVLRLRRRLDERAAAAEGLFTKAWRWL